MNRVMGAALAAGLLSSGPSAAAMVDMSAMTCAQLLELGEPGDSLAVAWLAGYLAGAEGEPMMDPERMAKGVAAVVAICADHPEMILVNAAFEAAAQ